MANPGNPWDRQQPGMTAAQAAEMIRLQRQANKQRGCLMGIVWTLLFGLWYWAWLAIKWSVKGGIALIRVGWRWTVTYPVKWSVALLRATWRGLQAATPWAVRGAQAFNARYGARGWGIAGAVVLVLIILGAIIH